MNAVLNKHPPALRGLRAQYSNATIHGSDVGMLVVVQRTAATLDCGNRLMAAQLFVTLYEYWAYLKNG